ncbi:helix-turn-helix domain-containing protein [Thermoproteota archaeon]
MSYEEFQRRISDNWLDPKEGRLYVMLAKSGSSKASDLARICDISRMDTYRILHRLEKKGIVQTVIGRPMKFQAVPPEKAFDILLRSASEKMLSMKSEKNRLLSLWPSQPVFEELNKDAERLRVIQGRVEFNNTLRRAVKMAHKEILILTTKNGLYRLFHLGFDKDFEEKSKKGISIKILSKVSKGENEAVEQFALISNLRHHTTDLCTQLIIIDSNQAISSTILDDSMSLTTEKDISLWLNSKEQITLLETLYNELWQSSIDLKTAHKIIETGVLAPQVRRLIGGESISQQINNLIDSAEISVTIITPSITNSPFLKDNSFALLQNASKKGVIVKLLTNFLDENTSLVEDLKNQFDIKITSIDSLTDMLIIDSTNVISINTSSNRNLIEEEAIFMSESSYATSLDRIINEILENAENVEGLLKSKRWLEHIQASIERATDLLIEEGFQIESPGIVINSLSQKIIFDLVAKKSGDLKRVVVHHLMSSQNLMTFNTKTTKIDFHKLILIIPNDFPEELIKLASFLGIQTMKISFTETSYKEIAKLVRESFL